MACASVPLHDSPLVSVTSAWLRITARSQPISSKTALMVVAVPLVSGHSDRGTRSISSVARRR